MAPREAFSAAWAALASSHVARVLTAKRKSQSATAYCASGPGRLTPALLTRPSIPLPAPVTSTRMVVSLLLLRRPGELGDAVGEVHLAVVLGRVADRALGAGQ